METPGDCSICCKPSVLITLRPSPPITRSSPSLCRPADRRLVGFSRCPTPSRTVRTRPALPQLSAVAFYSACRCPRRGVAVVCLWLSSAGRAGARSNLSSLRLQKSRRALTYIAANTAVPWSVWAWICLDSLTGRCLF
ncbi:hypothetical protein RRG08_014662 [Elysia crispata]|uniref:Uncharacterized protein n=1 Tax=Elysia crispata TaxID=231223 RepID=A0AAE0YI37_9GAST|nr:hypothetical protein RRG08_014662 [Elysia crispata]